MVFGILEWENWNGHFLGSRVFSYLLFIAHDGYGGALFLFLLSPKYFVRGRPPCICLAAISWIFQVWA